MRVLFASGIDGFCHRYAVLHWAEQLATQGIASSVYAHSDGRLAAALREGDLLVLYRVPFSAWIEHLLARAHTSGCVTVFAVDDLIVDPALHDPPPARRLAPAARALWQDGVHRYRATLLACDAALVTSAPLVGAGRAAGKPTYLHRAGAAAGELALGDAARAARARGSAAGTRPDRVRLGYFSGTPTHDDDFATVAPILAALLARNPAVELLIAGPLRASAPLAAHGERVMRVPLVPWPELPALIATTDVNLAPLEWQHPFVAAKGAIKYLEAAGAGVPTIASPTDAFRHAIRHGDNGMLARDAADWRAAVEALVGGIGMRARLGVAAAADVRARFDPVTQGRALASILRGIMAEHARPPEHDAPGPADELPLARAFPSEVARRAREPHGLPGTAFLERTTETPPLGDGTALTQTFRSTVDQLARVDVHTVTYGQTLDHEIRVEVRRADGSLVGSMTLPAALVPDNDWLAIDLPPEPDSLGRDYAVVLQAHGTGHGNAVSFAAGPRSAAAPYRLGAHDGPGPLALRTFSADPPGGGASAGAARDASVALLP